MQPRVRRIAIPVGLLVLGVGVFTLLNFTKASPKPRPVRERGQPVRVLELKSIRAVPRATGYGVVEAQRDWQAIAQVAGTIEEMAPDLEVGRTIRQGTLLFKIDADGYKLEKSRTEATVRAVRAQAGEIKAREASARASLKVETKVLNLAKKELERVRGLHEKGLSSATDVENAERSVLTAEKAVQNLKNTIQELPASRRVLEAQLAQQQTGVEGARIDLERTEVVAPFTMRIRQLNVSLHQAVSSGQTVLIGDGIDVMEVPARLPVGTIGPLLGPRLMPRPEVGPPTAEGVPTIDPTEVKLPAEADAGAPPETPAADGGAPRTGGRASAISAVIRLKSQGVETSWNGKFRRFQGVDPATRTMTVVVQVDEPRKRQGGSGPPLSPGLHVEVELRGSERTSCLAIPRSALHRDKVRVVAKGKRLEQRLVQVELLQEDYACLSGGVSAGDQVILTELTPAVEGMRLLPQLDEAAATWLQQVALGEKPQP